MKKSIFLSIAVLFLIGCSSPCYRGQINSAFIGFSAADIDTFILRQYKPNDNYLHLIDTSIIVNTGSIYYSTSNDTTTVFVNSSNLNDYITAGYDWELYIPAKNKTVLFSNIVDEINSGYKGACLNPVKSFVQDGQFTVPGFSTNKTFPISGFVAYIHN
jgi:hypothetical protein